jgi:hypothetical protein
MFNKLKNRQNLIVWNTSFRSVGAAQTASRLVRAEFASTACSPIVSRHFRKTPVPRSAPVFRHIR